MEPGTSEPQEQASVARKAKRILSDSSRYLLAGVRAALSGPEAPTIVVLDQWRDGVRELQLARTSLAQLVTECLARQTAACAAKGLDLLLEQLDRLPEVVVDPARISAVVEVVLEAARDAAAAGCPVRARTVLEPGRAQVVVSVDIDGFPPGTDEASPLGIARAIALAHHGDLAVTTAERHLELALVLPVPDAPPEPS
jgi:signal transduction histidine kinase